MKAGLSLIKLVNGVTGEVSSMVDKNVDLIGFSE